MSFEKANERITEIINDRGRILKEIPKVKALINSLKETGVVDKMSKGSWVCNHCGSRHISCNFKTEVYGYGKPNVFGIANIEDIKNAEISSIGDIITDLYWCEDCQKEAKNITDLAHWEFNKVEKEAVVFVDEIKKITKRYPIDLDSMSHEDYIKYLKARDEYNLDEILALYEKYPKSKPIIDGDEGEMPDLFEDSVPNGIIDISEFDYEINGDKIENVTSRIFRNR